jgi:8-oxo-dGTP diphosphatase
MAIKYWVGAKAFIYNTKLKKFLILRRSLDDFGAGLWENAGGKKEMKEDIRDTLKREIFEETGIEVKEYKLCYATGINEDKNPFMVIGFLVPTTKEDIELSFEHTEYKWVTKDEMFELVDRGIKADFIDGKIEELVKEYE